MKAPYKKIKKVLRKYVLGFKIVLGSLIVFLLIAGFLTVRFLLPAKTSAKQALVQKNIQPSLPIRHFTPQPTSLPVASVSPTLIPRPRMPQIHPASLGYCLNVPILLYHHIEPMSQASQEGHAKLTVDLAIFDQQMAYLSSRGYKTISAEDLVKALIAHQTVPAKSVVVTLDDGYSDAYTYAFPVFKKYNMIGNLMIPSGLLNNPGYLTWNQLKEMAQSGSIQVYNHTWSHAALGYATREKIEYELTTSQNQLQSNLGQKIDVFAYPYGSFSPLSIALLRQHGFIGGLSTQPGTLQCDSYIMTLKRNHIGNAPMSLYGF